jgi:superfamily II DNA or RNA helicase
MGPVVYETNTDQLVDDGIVLDVEIRVVPTEFRAPWYTAITRGDEGIGSSGRAPSGPELKMLMDELTEDAGRTRLATELALTEKRAGHSVVVLSHRVQHVLEFDSLFAQAGEQSGVLIGGDDHHERFEETRHGLRSRQLFLASATYGAFGVGQDVPAIDRGVMATPIGGNRQLFGQVVGRFCRAGKSDAALYVLWDRHVYGSRMLENIVRWNRRVLVRDGEQWVEGRSYARRLRDERRSADEAEDGRRRAELGGVFSRAGSNRG